MARYAELYLAHRQFGDGPAPVTTGAFLRMQSGAHIFDAGGFVTAGSEAVADPAPVGATLAGRGHPRRRGCFGGRARGRARPGAPRARAGSGSPRHRPPCRRAAFGGASCRAMRGRSRTRGAPGRPARRARWAHPRGALDDSYTPTAGYRTNPAPAQSAQGALGRSTDEAEPSPTRPLRPTPGRRAPPLVTRPSPVVRATDTACLPA